MGWKAWALLGGLGLVAASLFVGGAVGLPEAGTLTVFQGAPSGPPLRLALQRDGWRRLRGALLTGPEGARVALTGARRYFNAWQGLRDWALTKGKASWRYDAIHLEGPGVSVDATVDWNYGRCFGTAAFADGHHEALCLMEDFMGGSLERPYRNAGIDDAAALEAFVARLKRALLAGDKVAVAAALRYPLTPVDAAGHDVRLNGPADLVARFDTIVDPAFKAQIQGYPTCFLFSRDQGVMLGRGAIWIERRGDSVPERYQVEALRNDAAVMAAGDKAYRETFPCH